MDKWTCKFELVVEDIFLKNCDISFFLNPECHFSLASNNVTNRFKKLKNLQTSVG